MTRRRARAGPPAAAEGPFPVVGVGASAGGLEAFTQLLGHLPARTGMAFVLVQHLDPSHPSLLCQVLARATRMPVNEAEDAMPIEPDHVYVIVPSFELGIASGRLKLTKPGAGRRPHLPIDTFFRELSLERGRRAIGVVLSGSGSDGTEGLRAIKAEHGLTLAQEPAQAKFSSMPERAIAAGVVDAALPLAELAAELVRFGRHPQVRARSKALRARAVPSAREPADEAPRPVEAARHLDRLLLSLYVPPAVLVNDELDILQFRGNTGDYLQHAPGAPSHNLANMARSGLMPSLRRALLKAKRTGMPARAVGVEVDGGASRKDCDVVVMPFAGLPRGGEPLFVVLFEPPAFVAKSSGKKPARAKRIDPRAAARVPRLEHELGATKEYLDAMIEEHGKKTGDLASANEELVSGNEELQSLNEELETTKGELVSANEELCTVNEELRSRNEEVSRINGDLVNLIDTLDVPIVILDKDRKIRRFTPKAHLILNVVPADVGRPFDDLRPNVDVPDLDERIVDVIHTVTPHESEVMDRKGRWYRMRIRPYRTPDDAVDGVVLSFVDIDALKHLVGEAHEARVEAERANRAKDQFLATLSHELRTPLATMLMHAQLLRRGDFDLARLQRTGAAIERGTRLQVQLIDDLLDVSRIVAGKLYLNVEPTDLTAVVSASIEGVAAQAKEKLIVIDVDLGGRIRAVSGDRVRLQQVISNLLTNAIKFTPKNGHVSVTLDAPDGVARLCVKDTGMGIAPAFLPHLFARFSQADPSNTRVHGGLGLGLAIVRHLVEAHGGTVVAESPGPELGATFTVCLPILADGVPLPLRSAPSVARADGELHDVRVLVVDDDAASRDATVSSLESAGADVRSADSAAGALAAVVAFRPNVLVSDIAMPSEDGYGLIRRIRALGGGSGGDVPALALTALAGSEDHRHALDAGYQTHLAKPVDIDHLVDAVVELAAISAAKPETRASPSSTR